MRGKPHQGLWYLLNASILPLREIILRRPIRFASMLRVAPGIAGIGLIPAAFWLMNLEIPLRAVAAAAVLAAAILLLLTSAALYLLSLPALGIFLPFARRLACHALVFFCLAFGVAARHEEWTEEFSKELILGLCVWILSIRLADLLFESLGWQRRHRIEPIDLGKDRVAYDVREYWLTCVHEAGHLLMYGLLSKVPEDAFAMADRNPRFGIGGLCDGFLGVQGQRNRCWGAKLDDPGWLRRRRGRGTRVRIAR
jgi:hypothetical protein